MKVIILRGIQGSGKSTYTKKFKENNPNLRVMVCSADHYFEDANGENYKFNPKYLQEAHAYCLTNYVWALECVNKYDVIFVDNTNTQLWEMSPYVALANISGCEVSFIRFVCSADKATKRNVHGVPAKSIENTLRRIEEILPFWGKETVIDTNE
jgi:predicted kinase